MTDVATDTDELVRILAECKRMWLEYEPVLKPLKEREAAAKGALLDAMLDAGDERKRKYGVLITKQVRTTVGISNLHEAMAWLEARGVLGSYRTIDAKRVHDAYPDCPGLYVEETPYISVREDKP